jgi:hypothetical protein
VAASGKTDEQTMGGSSRITFRVPRCRARAKGGLRAQIPVSMLADPKKATEATGLHSSPEADGPILYLPTHQLENPLYGVPVELQQMSHGSVAKG